MQLGVVGFVMALWIGMLVPRAHADARQPVPAQAPREGRIALSHNINLRAQSWSADAVFTNTPVWGTVVATDGPCALHHTVPPTGLSAGTITISGTVEPITLIEHGGASAVRYRTSGGVPQPTYVEGAQLTVEAAGGADLPAFAATVAAPRELTGYTPPTSLSRAGGYTATWTAVSGSEIMLILTVTNARREGVLVMCRAPDTGTFTV
ncbi:MAG: hypothetical protein NT062_19095, partial [Proteobacteria bacterium]|nr:hypothetical protein [Pseudomonadota bacterium]